MVNWPRLKGLSWMLSAQAKLIVIEDGIFHKESLVISNIQTQDMGFDCSRR